MSGQFKVSVVKFPDRKSLQLKYIDPITGAQKYRSAKTTVRREAERAAATWEKELEEGRYCGSRITWEDFRERFEVEKLRNQKPTTFMKVNVVFNSIEKHINPKRLQDLTADRLSTFQVILRDQLKLSKNSISSMMAHLRSALQWAVNKKLLAAVPHIDREGMKGGNLMKGRPLVREEYERMLAVVAKVVGDDAAESYRRLLRGIWDSGLRLSEAMALTWDQGSGLWIDLTGKYPKLVIPASQQKSGKDEIVPITKEFYEFLLETPEAERHGNVFNPQPKRKNQPRPSMWWVSRVICQIGEKANIKVSERKNERGKKDKAGNLKPSIVKFASAHDLRRSFGTRLASKVKPAVLKKMMRHANINTTMDYYIDLDADDVSRELWAFPGYSSGYTHPQQGISQSPERSNSSEKTVVGTGIEPVTHGFSVHCSTN